MISLHQPLVTFLNLVYTTSMPLSKKNVSTASGAAEDITYDNSPIICENFTDKLSLGRL